MCNIAHSWWISSPLDICFNLSSYWQCPSSLESTNPTFYDAVWQVILEHNPDPAPKQGCAPTSVSHYASPVTPLETPLRFPTVSPGRSGSCLLCSGPTTPGLSVWPMLLFYVPAERMQTPRFPPVTPKWKCKWLVVRRMKINSDHPLFEARTMSYCLHSCLAHSMLTKLLLNKMKRWGNKNSGLLGPSQGSSSPCKEGMLSSILAPFEAILPFNHSRDVA